MRKYLSAAFLTLLIWLPIMSAPVLAAESASPEMEEELIEVSVSGEGRDAASALNNAYRKAVDEAVSSLVDEQARMDGKEAIDSQILSHSGNFVAKHTPVGKPEVRGGETIVRAEVSVKRDTLWQAVQDAGIVNVTQ